MIAVANSFCNFDVNKTTGLRCELSDHTYPPGEAVEAQAGRFYYTGNFRPIQSFPTSLNQ